MKQKYTQTNSAKFNTSELAELHRVIEAFREEIAKALGACPPVVPDTKAYHRLVKIEQRVIDYVGKTGRPVTNREISVAINLSEKRTHQIIYNMTKDGKLIRNRTGVEHSYELPPEKIAVIPKELSKKY